MQSQKEAYCFRGTQYKCSPKTPKAGVLPCLTIEVVRWDVYLVDERQIGKRNLKEYNFCLSASLIKLSISVSITALLVFGGYLEVWRMISNLWLQGVVKLLHLYLIAYAITFTVDYLMCIAFFYIRINEDGLSFREWKLVNKEGSTKWSSVSWVYVKGNKYFLKVAGYILRLPAELPNRAKLIQEIDKFLVTTSISPPSYLFTTPLERKNIVQLSIVRILLIALAIIVVISLIVQDHNFNLHYH